MRTLSAVGPYECRLGNSYGPIIGPYLFLGKFVWTNGPDSSSFPLHWYWSMDGSSHPEGIRDGNSTQIFQHKIINKSRLSGRG